MAVGVRAHGDPARPGPDRLGLGRLHGLLAHVPAAVAYLHGPDLVFGFANDGYRELVGGREVLGLPVREALPEVAGQGYFEMLDRVMATGQPAVGREAEVRVDRGGPEPELLYLDFVYQPVRGDGGRTEGILVQATDVTRYVRDRQALQSLTAKLAAAEERYRTLFETLPYGVVYHDSAGVLITANPAAERILGMDLDAMMGREPGDMVWHTVREDGAPMPRDEVPGLVALRTGEVVRDAILGFRHGVTGELRWLSVNAVPDSFTEAGRPRRAYTMFVDITEQRRAAAALAEAERLVSRLGESNVLGILLADEQRIYEANDAVLDMIGYGREDLEAGHISWRDITPAEWADADDRALEELRRTGAFAPFEKEYLHRDGRRVPILLGGAVISRDPLRWVTFIVDLSKQRRAERDRAEAADREREARAAAQTTREQLEFLLRAGAMLRATRDGRELLRQAADLVVPPLGDWCAVFLPDTAGVLRAEIVRHADPSKAPLAETLRGRPVPEDSPLPARLSYRTGTTQVVRDVRAALQAWRQDHPGLLGMASRLDADNLLAAPLVGGDRTLGVLGIGRGADRPPFTEGDASLAAELGRQLAVGLGNAQMSAREHSVAETLQRAVLPELLPDVAGVELAARYLPATDGIDVGGDWYDAFPLGGDLLGIAVGDVVGHSVVSASVMGQIRNILRAYALKSPDPATVLEDTNTAITALIPDTFATVFYGVLDAGTGELSYANAGHPQPLVAGPDGGHFLDGGSGIMLGVAPEVRTSGGRYRLRAGERLVLYTDGLVEDHTRQLGEGMAALLELALRCTAPSVQELCDTLVADVVGTRPLVDDVCLLGLRLTGGTG